MSNSIKILSVLVFTIFLNAQIESITFKHFNSKNGLSQNSVYAILQDSKGFLWVGTKDGLNKYDGYTFKQYKQNEEESLRDNFIRSLYEDSKQRLWIGTEYGALHVYDREQDLIRPIKSQNPVFNNIKTIFSMTSDQNGNLWVCTRYLGLLKYNIENNEFSYPNFKQMSDLSFPFQHATSIIYENNSLWIGTSKGAGLAKVDLINNNYYTYFQKNKLENQNDVNIIYSMTKGKNNLIWLATVGGLSSFNDSKNEFQHFPLSSGWKNTYLKGIVEDEFGIIWAATTRFGVCKFDPKTKIFEFYQSHTLERNLIEQNDIEYIYKDRNDLLWIGMNGDGLSNFNPNPKFRLHNYTSNEKTLLSSPSVRAITVDQKNTLWIGDYGGLNRYNRKTGEIRYFKYDENGESNLDNGNIYSLLSDHSNQLWVGTEGGGLFKYHSKTEKFSNVYDFNHDDTKFVYEIFQDSKKNIWVGTYGGLIKLNPYNEKRVNTSAQLISSLEKESVFAIEEDSIGRLWIGSEANGIYVINNQGHILDRFINDENNPLSLSSNKIKSIYNDSKGTIWIGTNGGGLNKFNATEKTFINYREDSGLSNNVIYGILEDDSYNLWLSTNFGLSKFSPNTNKTITYTEDDGLQSNEFNTAAFYKSIDGEMFFGGIKGLNSFYPNRVSSNKNRPTIQITEFNISNKPISIAKQSDDRQILKKDISETELIELNYTDNIISFEFTALSFNAPQKNRYAYRLENFNTDWIYTDAKNRVATYTNLEAGEYIFTVKGSNEDGIWNNEGRSLKLVVIPPIWATWYAYTSYVLLFIFAIWFFIKWQLNAEQKLNIKLRKMVDERTNELKERNEEIRSQYDLISGVIESLTDPFYVVDINENKVVLENTAAKKSFIKSKLKEFEELSHNIINEVLKSHKPMLKQSTYVSDSGKLIDLEFSVYPVKDKEGIIKQVINYWKNISDRKELERSIELNLQMKSNELKSKILRVSNLREQLILISNAIETESNKLNGKKDDFDKINNRLKKLIEEEKNEFDFWYSEENKDFFDRLKLINNSLTKRQLRICTLLRLNLNTKEIAEIFQLAPKTVEVYRSQIREKLAIPKEENLNKYISEI